MYARIKKGECKKGSLGKHLRLSFFICGYSSGKCMRNGPKSLEKYPENQKDSRPVIRFCICSKKKYSCKGLCKLWDIGSQGKEDPILLCMIDRSNIQIVDRKVQQKGRSRQPYTRGLYLKDRFTTCIY